MTPCVVVRNPTTISALPRACGTTWPCGYHFLDNVQGAAYFPESAQHSGDVLSLFTDRTRAKDLGWGVIFGNKWVCSGWPASWDSGITHITFLELLLIVLAFMIWGNMWNNKTIILRIGNQALVYIINRQSSQSKRIMSLSRAPALVWLPYNVYVTDTHIVGMNNELLQFFVNRNNDPAADSFS